MKTLYISHMAQVLSQEQYDLLKTYHQKVTVECYKILVNFVGELSTNNFEGMQQQL